LVDVYTSQHRGNAHVGKDGIEGRWKHIIPQKNMFSKCELT